MDNQQFFSHRLLQSRWVLHIGFWTMAFLISAMIKYFYFQKWGPSIGDTFIFMPIRMAAAYWLTYSLIPQFLFKRKFLQFILFGCLGLYFFMAIGRLTAVYVVEPIWFPGNYQEPVSEILLYLHYLIKGYFFRVMGPALFLIIFKLIRDHRQNLRKREALEKEKINNELKFLKAQIHPHFLFNTLNNLYALTLKKSDKAPETVLKLSAMMDYMLYESRSPRVPMQKEIQLIRDYIDLELLRYGDRMDLVFREEVDDTEAPLSPMLLLSLVENAFKHGASGEIERPRIEIDLELKNGQLSFKVFNTKGALNPDRNRKQEGIGENNLKRQLELIYPNRYQMKIKDTKDQYEVQLRIDLEAVAA